MATVERTEAPVRLILDGISWETYEMLLNDLGDQPKLRIRSSFGRWKSGFRSAVWPQ